MGQKQTAEFRQGVALTGGLSRKQVASDFCIGFRHCAAGSKKSATIFRPLSHG
jgi:hypothetical protein